MSGSDWEVIATQQAKDHSKALELLKVAKCPNAHCVDGLILEGFEHVFQCQFCAERKELLAENGK